MLRQLHVGDGIARGLEVEQQRHDGMAVRRHGQLALAVLRQAAEARDDGAHQIADQAQELAPLRRSEVPSLLGK